MDNITNFSGLQNSIGKFAKKTFGEAPIFIVDSTTVSPTGEIITYMKCLTDVTGFTATCKTMVSGSGAFPTELIAGTEIPGHFQDVSVTAGSIYCLM